MGIGRRIERLEGRSRERAEEMVRAAWDGLTDRELALASVHYHGYRELSAGEETERAAGKARLKATLSEETVSLALGARGATEEEITARRKELLAWVLGERKERLRSLVMELIADADGEPKEGETP